jgi:beta-1,2-mannobiose phosphorylase / 1,2-beta-oligomannan phosphorylase
MENPVTSHRQKVTFSCFANIFATIVFSTLCGSCGGLPASDCVPGDHDLPSYQSVILSEAEGIRSNLNSFTALMESDSNPVIPCGSSSDWDTVLREIGNVLYDPGEPDPQKRYKTLYSGYQPPYIQDKVYVGIAFSPDGINWTKKGKVFEQAAEDPYLVKNNGRYYLYFENKQDVPFRDIHLATSTDCLVWEEYPNNPVLKPKGMGEPWNWEVKDVSSPTIWVEGGTWYMFYEGRGGGYGGKIGLATSSDGLSWTRVSDRPVFDADCYGKWDGSNVVPDDILKVDGSYYLLYHGEGAAGPTGFWGGMAYSNNLIDWTRYANNPIVTSTDTVMFYFDNGIVFHMLTEGGIGKFYPAQPKPLN